MEKLDYRTLDEQTRYENRKRAMVLIKSGVKKKVVAAQFGVKAGTISDWVKLHAQGGNAALKCKKKGPNSEDMKSLSCEQEKAIQRMIIDKMPEQLRLPYGLWTRKAISELVEREFGVVLAVSTMSKYLRSWGFTPQKPKKRAYEQSSAAVQKWLVEDYPAIKKRAKQEGAQIHWTDETGVANSCNHGRSFAPIGLTPIKMSMCKKFSVNMASTITNQGLVEFMIYEGTMNSERFIEFLEHLTKERTNKIFLILDNLRVHHSQVVRDWAECNREKIELFFLPAYSPEYNPDEYLNCDLKGVLSSKPAPKSQKTLRDNIENCMNMLSSNPERIRKYFKHNSIKYAA